MPLSGDRQVVSCAEDGQVRIAELSATGACESTRKLAEHKGPAHTLAVQKDSPHTFLSCGEDAVIFEIDLRKEGPENLLLCKENGKKVSLYSIFINPSNPVEYVVGGNDHFVRVYDKRAFGKNGECLKKYLPQHLVNQDKWPIATSVVYSYNGQEILASYNGDDIYIFDSQTVDTTTYLHRYRGHRNNKNAFEVSGVNFFGPKSEYVVSGSDCGHIFFWEKESENIVKFMHGGGVVNCVEPHPNMAVLAASSLDEEIKIWVPSCEDPPDMSGLEQLISKNMKIQEEERRLEGSLGTLTDQLMWFTWKHLKLARLRAHQCDQNAATNSSSGDSENEDSVD